MKIHLSPKYEIDYCNISEELLIEEALKNAQNIKGFDELIKRGKR